MVSSQQDFASTTTDSAEKCPVDHQNRSSLWKVLGVRSKAADSTSSSSGSSLAASLEEAAKYSQLPHSHQRIPLSTYRSESSIPRSKKDNDTNITIPLPHHQLGSDSSKWVYPSEQQVFNAMKRKGWEGIEEEAIPSFLMVHNSVNERSWREVCKWEHSSDSTRIQQHDIQLVRFEGRPKDISPKAWFRSTFLFQDKPFDRHDWYIDNGTGHEKRYVLDFYMTENKAMGMPRVEIDVRPALDTPQALVQRGKRILQEVFPGIARELEKLNQRSSSQDS
jgi:cytochrome c heme-lyase